MPEIQLNRSAGRPTLQRGQPAQQEEPEPSRYTGNVEEDAQIELSEVLAGFKDRARIEQQRFTDATDSEYWVCFCFQTREQKEEFLQKLNLLDLGDKYLDGMEAARQMGVELTSRVPEMPRHRPFDRDLIRLVR